MTTQQKPRLHRDWIDPHAFGIVRALQKNNYKTFLVGGCVRDLLLGIMPKDFDIGTMARPQEVKRVIHKSYIIGRRFRLVLVKREDQQFEVATFRREVKDEDLAGLPEDQPIGDNFFGSPEEDSRRRDFTVNALFYDPVADELIDYANGMEDLKEGIIRMIGDPVVRVTEDPIRILRAIRLSHKIRFAIEPSLMRAMESHASELNKSALPRRREEYLKFLRLDDPSAAFLQAYDLGVLKSIAPRLNHVFETPEVEDFLKYLRRYHERNFDSDNTTELFAGLILAYYRTTVQSDPNVPVTQEELLDHPEIQPMMREELGLHKIEQSLIAKAMHLQSILQKRDEFIRRGERRQIALLRNDAFGLALKLAAQDHALSPDDWHFWHWQFEKVKPSLGDPRERPRRPRRRRRSRGDSSTREMQDAGLTNEDEVNIEDTSAKGAE